MVKPLMEVLSIGFSCYGEYIGNLGFISFGELLNLMSVWLGWACDENLCLNNINSGWLLLIMVSLASLHCTFLVLVLVLVRGSWFVLS